MKCSHNNFLLVPSARCLWSLTVPKYIVATLRLSLYHEQKVQVSADTLKSNSFCTLQSLSNFIGKLLGGWGGGETTLLPFLLQL